MAADKSRVSGPGPVPWRAPFTCHTLPLFLERLGRLDNSRALDVGPVCGQNITFFAHHVTQLYICDLFQHLDRKLPRGTDQDALWKPLDYPPQHFQGLLLWDLIDRLPDEEVPAFIDVCHKLLAPQGLLLIFSLPEVDAPPVHSFVVGPDYRITLRRQAHLSLDFTFRHSRTLERFLLGFRPVKSFVLKSGLREFLFERI
ncbi:MAG: hypothetical protein KJ621_11690 [Proteobacteria bacterium]|nr:hypothetical protein [Pseudomonadota bacterium]MBU1742588.1 hypothetical protein [Pseudomonadota bacterium]